MSRRLGSKNLDHLFQVFEERLPQSDYLVGWVDCFGAGDGLGRGQVHQANYFQPGEDPNPAQTLRVENQELPDSILGIVPKSVMWRFMKPFVNDPGMRLINGRQISECDEARRRSSAHAIPRRLCISLGLRAELETRLQARRPDPVPELCAERKRESVFAEQITLAQEYGLVPYLGVFKKHRPDDFLMTHAVDGYSLALDFGGCARKSAAGCSVLPPRWIGWCWTREGGSTSPKTAPCTKCRRRKRSGRERAARFLALKQATDPENLLQTNLSRRLFGFG